MWDFHIVGIEKARLHDADSQGTYYRYVIANNVTTITGIRAGTEGEVTAFVKSSIQRLNSRHLSNFPKSVANTPRFNSDTGSGNSMNIRLRYDGLQGQQR